MGSGVLLPTNFSATLLLICRRLCTRNAPSAIANADNLAIKGALLLQRVIVVDGSGTRVGLQNEKMYRDVGFTIIMHEHPARNLVSVSGTRGDF